MAKSRWALLSGNRKLYLALACGVVLFVIAVGARTMQPPPVKPAAVEAFNELEFEDPNCWQFMISGGHIEYTNTCASNTEVEMEHVDGSKAIHVIAPGGKLVAFGGNMVHIIGQVEERMH
ncbi:MAG: hypothetical protein HY314_10390 [Acidobacteria bacterium]|nr:hypothetical protein [Acidobacteriota bacterium]